MDFENVVEHIVQEVLKKLEEKRKEKKKNFLVAITGGYINNQEILLELKKLKDFNNLNVIFSQAGEELYSKEDFKGFNIVSNINKNVYQSLIEENDILILPFLTKNSCSKIAYGIRDTNITYLVSMALLNKKSIIAVYDSCITRGDTEYEKQLNFNIHKLKSYGVIFVKGKELYDYIINKKDFEINYLKSKKIITNKDIYNIKNKKIKISKKTIVTSLAKEIAKDNDVYFEKE